MKKRVVTLLITCIMLIVSTMMPMHGAVPVDPDPIVPMWDNTNTFVAYLTFSGTTGDITSTIVGKSGVSNITAEVLLYYKNASGSWVKDSREWDYDVDQMYLTITESFTGVPGREYKIEINATLTKNGVEEDVSKTATGTCPPNP